MDPWKDLEELYKQFKDAETNYYRLRYHYWQRIHYIKNEGASKRLTSHSDAMTFKEFEGACRRLTKKLRKQLQKPRGAYQLDHRTSILEAYYRGWTVTETCALKNLEWIPSRNNTLKGILSSEAFSDWQRSLPGNSN